MNRQRAALLYSYGIASVGIGFWLLTLVIAGPWTSGNRLQSTTLNTAILLILAFMSSVSPVRTRVGSTMTVGMAPMFGAVLLLPPWAAMTIAVIGTIDLRRPGTGIAWDRFLFNRGQFALIYGLPSAALTILGITPHHLSWYIALPLVVLAITGLNIGLMSIAVWLVSGSPIRAAAQKVLASSVLTYFALALVGYMIWSLMENKHFPDQLVVFLLYGPLLVYRASLHQRNRLDQWLRDSFIMQSRVVDKRDGQTFGHSQRVGELCETIARMMHLSEEQCNTIRVGGILHDLGKIAIPDSILLKPGKLTPEEYEIIKTHPVEGAQILAEHPEQMGVSEIVRHHHERWDGKGYPDGLKGEQIPLGSRIVNACDAFDTITQARVFRPTVKTPAEAIHELRELAGTWYDPDVITALEKIVAERWGIQVSSPPKSVPLPKYSEVLAIKPFRLLWLGQAVSYFGDMMNTTGLAIMLYVVTRSPSLVALGLIAKAIPTVVFGLIAGPIVDRFNRQRVMIGTDLVRALLTVTIPFLAFHWLPGVFVAVFVIATTGSFFSPAKQAVIPNLVPQRFLVKANGLVLSSERAMELLGYSAAGLIAGALSWAPLFLIDAATYIFSATTLLGVPDLLRAGATRQMRIRADIAEGLRFIVHNPVLRSTMSLTMTGAFFGGMTVPTLIVLAYSSLRAGPIGYGVLEAVIGGGAIVGAIAAPLLITRHRAGILILAGVAGAGVAYALTGLTQTLPSAIIFLFAGGAANAIYLIPLISVTQREAPDYVRGRVMASRFLLAQAGLLGGMALAGPLNDRLGAPLLFVFAGTMIVIAAMLGFAFRNLRGATLRDVREAPILKAASG